MEQLFFYPLRNAIIFENMLLNFFWKIVQKNSKSSWVALPESQAVKRRRYWINFQNPVGSH